MDDPKAKALFETSTEVLTGLKTAYEHYSKGPKRPGGSLVLVVEQSDVSW